MGRVDTEFETVRAKQTSASGLAAVWAKENTREALFEALKRLMPWAVATNTAGDVLGIRLRQLVFAQLGQHVQVAMCGELIAC